MTLVRHRIANIASTRDLVARIVEAANAAARSSSQRHVVTLVAPKLSPERAEAVFRETVAVLRPDLAKRLGLELKLAERVESNSTRDVVTLPARPSTRYDLVRHLLDARIAQRPPVPGRVLCHALGLSEHPIREAGRVLEAAGLIRTTHAGRSLVIEPWECTPDLLSRLDVKPVRVRYRYRAGATPLSAAALTQRFLAVCDDPFPSTWLRSGADAALTIGMQVDLSGAPRVDLLIRVPSHQRTLDLSWLSEIAPRMEREPNPLETAPLVVTIVCEETPLESEDPLRRIASHADITLGLLDQGLTLQAREFVAGVRDRRKRATRTDHP